MDAQTCAVGVQGVEEEVEKRVSGEEVLLSLDSLAAWFLEDGWRWMERASVTFSLLVFAETICHSCMLSCRLLSIHRLGIEVVHPRGDSPDPNPLSSHSPQACEHGIGKNSDISNGI